MESPEPSLIVQVGTAHGPVVREVGWLLTDRRHYDPESTITRSILAELREMQDRVFPYPNPTQDCTKCAAKVEHMNAIFRTPETSV